MPKNCVWSGGIRLRKLRNIVYVNNLNENEFVYYGIESKEFMEVLLVPIYKYVTFKRWQIILYVWYKNKKWM
ncbi:MAG: hypothetical protein JWM44_3881 [Bacilli bacterium]|nr:hypothetical protein [Bacilli bacterium]